MSTILKENSMANVEMAENVEREELPRSYDCINYDIELTPNFDSFKYVGALKMHMKLYKPTDIIVLNSKELDIQEALITEVGSKVPLFAHVSYELETERVIFKFPSILEIGEYELGVDFIGCHNEKMAGFYRSKYVNENGEEKYLVTTQFESTDARRAFPCMDEPNRKSTFDITLIVPKELTTLSNMPIEKEDEFDNLKSVKFQTTPIMSTYLLAFFVGECDYVEQTMETGTLVRVYTPKGKSEQGNFSLNLTCEVLKFFSEYFDNEYPLPKMDLIAIPDFAGGAMENWGLITFRSKYLLYEESVTSARGKAILAYVVCHELAHQWFGNLVTMEWWSGLWLNESFATWVGWMAVDHFHPEWKVWELFVIDEFDRAMNLDMLESSHPIKNDVTKATQVGEIFDAITYSKGASVLRMLVNALGEDVFRSGLRNYLQKFKYSNAKSDDLWTSLSEVSGKDVSKLMESWINQTGFPVVSLYSDKKNNQVHLMQQKFNSNNLTQKWIIPVEAITEDSGDIQKVTMDSTALTLDHDYNKWIKLNNAQTGFFLTSYDSHMRSQLTRAIKNKELSPIDRAEIVDTLFRLVFINMELMETLFDFIPNAYENEDEYIVWRAIISGFDRIKRIWSGNDVIKNMIDSITYPLLYPMYQRLGWESNDTETYQTIQLRSLVLNGIGYSDEVMNEARERFEKYCNKRLGALPTDVRCNAFNLLSKYSNDETQDDVFNKLCNIIETTESKEVQIDAVKALGCFKCVNMLTKSLDYCYKSGNIRSQDAFIVSAVASHTNPEYNWDYMVENWEKLHGMYGNGNFLFGRIIKCGMESLYDVKKLKEAEEFIKAHDEQVSDIKNTIKQAIETAYISIKIKDTHSVSLTKLANEALLTTDF
jgi:aminopeptidase N